MEKLIEQFMEAKEKESEAKALRTRLAAEIVELYHVKEEGSNSTMVGDYKVTTKTTINRKVDWDKFYDVDKRFPDHIAPMMLKPQLDKKGLDYWKTEAPEYYASLIREAITETPGAPSVTVSIKEK